MSTMALNWARRQTIADGTMKTVLTELAVLHRPERLLFPSQKYLAVRVGRSPRTVWTALVMLEHFGVIARRRRSNGSYGRTSDEFTLTLGADFTLGRNAISTAKKGISKSQELRLASVPAQLAEIARGSRNNCEGVGDKQKSSSQEEGKTTNLEIGDTHARDGDRPSLRVVAGGRT